MGSIATLDQREGAVDVCAATRLTLRWTGIDANDWQNQAAFTSALPVTLDSVQEFRVTTTNAKRYQRRRAAAVAELVTKSGTDKFHGMSAGTTGRQAPLQTISSTISSVFPVARISGILRRFTGRADLKAWVFFFRWIMKIGARS
jgi:hypothetical protein